MTAPDASLKVGGLKRGRKRWQEQWLAERRKRRLRDAIRLAVPVTVVVSIVALAAVLAPPAQRGACEGDFTEIHYHPRLDFYNGPNRLSIPPNIELSPDLWKDHRLDACSSGRGAAPLHVHEGPDEQNVIHVEGKIARNYTLGEFFAIWGQPIGPRLAWIYTADTTHTLRMVVNGEPSAAWGDLVLADGQVIEIHYDRTG